jgi:tetratricopeptide (TPR) repeat protein
MNLGQINYRLGKLPQAIADFDRALGYDPRLPEANFLIGSTYLEMGDLPKARVHLQRELALNPRHRKSALLLQSVDRGGPPPPGDRTPAGSPAVGPGAR